MNQNKKKALITGISGQDGAYLTKLLLEQDYLVYGLVRGKKEHSFKNLDYLNVLSSIELIECDLLDFTQTYRLIQSISPHEIYNLAAQSSVGQSFQQPIGTISFNTLSVLNLLESIRLLNNKNIRFYQASSSEMFGNIQSLPIKETSVIHPVSPYGISKATGHWTTINYRETYGLFACCGIFFNHESHLRSPDFFFKKIIQQSIEIKNGKRSHLKVGNIDIKRDFGFGPKYVEVMWKMLQQDRPEDFIICSGKSHSLREIIHLVFTELQLPFNLIITDEQFCRPNEIKDIYGDPSKAKEKLGWQYEMSIDDLIKNLLQEELCQQKQK